MIFSISMKRLLWKDTRLLLPIVFLLLGLSAISHLMYCLTIQDESVLQETFLSILLAVPACYATGAAILLISREKETQSLTWLRSLPISPKRIAASKMIAATFWFIVIWLASLVFYGLAISSRLGFEAVIESLVRNTANRDELFSPFFLVNLTIVVFSLGWFVAWRFKNSVQSILAMLPITLILFIGWSIIVSSIGKMTVGWFEFSSGPGVWLVQSTPSIVFLLICVGLLGWGWKSACRALHSDEPTGLSFAPILQRAKYWMFTSSVAASNFERRPILTPTSALIWQFARQNRFFLVGIVPILFVMPWLIPLAIQIESNPKLAYLRDFSERVFAEDLWPLLIAFGMFGPLLATCWLGISVFHRDASQQSFRFLAERGLSASHVWWTRQAVRPSATSLISLTCKPAV
jgi:ABC-type transport system involved in multi-copper enzyme maturation permease subunit